MPSAAKESSTQEEASTNQSSSNLFGGQDAPLEVACKGPCVFDFTDQTVSFTDQVVVKKIGPDTDSVTCDKLKIKFDQKLLDEKPNAQLAGSQEAPQSSESKQELGIKSLIAEGSPVVVNAISRPAKITATRLIYCLLYTSPSPRDLSTSRMPSSA